MEVTASGRAPSPRAVVIGYMGAFGDPPMRQAAQELAARGYEITFLQLPSGQDPTSDPTGRFKIENILPPARFRQVRFLSRLLGWQDFAREIRRHVESIQPQLVLAWMPLPLAALPRPAWPYHLACFLPDIPVLPDAGRLDRRLIRRGWNYLAHADVVWASDIYKARLAQEIARLPELPLVCHNCPPRDYLPEPETPRDGWLRAELRRAGATIGETGGSILLRAGAVGECCGIEETLAGMARLPEDYIFVLMGRPPDAYKNHLRTLIAALGLERRAIFWDRPSDEVWKKALQGADIGHLIHGPFPPGRMRRLYEMNSSLSNNRLFQYMAAGLPIIAYDDPRLNDIYTEVPCFRVARLAHLETDLTAGWAELGADAAQRLRLGAAGRAGHLKTYYWERQFAPVLDAIENAVRPKVPE